MVLRPVALILEEQLSKKKDNIADKTEMELSFIEKLIEMYKYRKPVANSNKSWKKR